MLVNYLTVEMNRFAMKNHREIQQNMNPSWELKRKSDPYLLNLPMNFHEMLSYGGVGNLGVSVCLSVLARPFSKGCC